MLKGGEHPLTSDRIFSYLGGDAPHYSVDQLDTNGADLLLNSSDGVGRMFAYENNSYKIITSSVVMAAIANGNALNYKPYVLSEMIDYFLGLNPVTALQEHLGSLANLQNFPNPFSASTTISYHIEKAGQVHFDIYSMKGELIKKWDEFNDSGMNHSSWDARDQSGRKVASGNYLLHLNTPGMEMSKQLIVR